MESVTSIFSYFICMCARVKGDAGTSGKPDFARAFHKAFDILDESFAASPGLKERPTTILFLTHTDAPSPVQEIVNRTNVTFANNREQLLIFPFGFGNGITEQAKATLKSVLGGGGLVLG